MHSNFLKNNVLEIKINMASLLFFSSFLCSHNDSVGNHINWYQICYSINVHVHCPNNSHGGSSYNSARSVQIVVPTSHRLIGSTRN